MIKQACIRGLVLAALVLTGVANAQTGADDPVLVENGSVKVYRSEYEAELLKLKPEIRAGFGNSKRRIADLLSRLLVQKSLAAQPEAQALAQTPVNRVRIRLEAERVLAQLRIDDIEARAIKAFDAQLPAYEARARELYAADHRKYDVPAQVEASHILFDLRKHSRDEGRKLAEQARARIMAGADFNAVAKEVSEDPSAAQNSGHLGWFKRGEMDQAFTDAAFALGKPGEVSQPVLSSFGWHLIKLENRRDAYTRPFDEVKALVLDDLRQKYVDQQRDAAIAAIRNDPGITLHREAVDALYIDTPAPSALPGPPAAHPSSRSPVATPEVSAPAAPDVSAPAAPEVSAPGAPKPRVPAASPAPAPPATPSSQPATKLP